MTERGFHPFAVLHFLRKTSLLYLLPLLQVPKKVKQDTLTSLWNLNHMPLLWKPSRPVTLLLLLELIPVMFHTLPFVQEKAIMLNTQILYSILPMHCKKA